MRNQNKESFQAGTFCRDCSPKNIKKYYKLDQTLKFTFNWKHKKRVPNKLEWSEKIFHN